MPLLLTLVVLASKGGNECGKSSTVSVALIDLQEMQNQMRESIDQGLADLQSKQGKGGLPVAPPSAIGAPVKTEFALAAPPPDPNVAAQIGQQMQDADRAEQEVDKVSAVAAAPGTPSAQPASPPVATALAAPPAEVSLGQTIGQVNAILGTPTRVVDLGAKKVYVYKDMKVTFAAGKVSDIQ